MVKRRRRRPNTISEYDGYDGRFPIFRTHHNHICQNQSDLKIYSYGKRLWILQERSLLSSKTAGYFLSGIRLERVVVSISANIAEGHELQSNKQFIKHLFIAKASCGEVRSLLILSKRLGLYPDSVLDPLIASSNKLSVKIYRLIEYRGGKR